MNESIMRAAGFGKEVDAIHTGKCPICGKEINMEDFIDELSRREFYISGMCQKCQNEIFNNEDDEDDDWDDDLYDFDEEEDNDE